MNMQANKSRSKKKGKKGKRKDLKLKKIEGVIWWDIDGGEVWKRRKREKERENACVYVCVNAILCGMPDRKRMEKRERKRENVLKERKRENECKGMNDKKSDKEIRVKVWANEISWVQVKKG